MNGFYANCEETVRDIKKKACSYDYVRFSYADINGICRAKIVPSRNVEAILKSGGIGLCSAILLLDASSNYVPLPYLEADGYPDCHVFPGEGTFSPCPWSGNDNFNIAEVLCSFHWRGTLRYLEADPRALCLKMTKKLEQKLSVECYNAFEYEFVLFDKKKEKAAFDGKDICATLVFKEVEELHYLIDKRLLNADVNVQTLQVEYGPGQNEIVIEPRFGITGADAAFRLKSCVKETSAEMGYHATFMSKPFETDVVTNSGHWNHSLWDDRGNNVMYDPSKPTGLSELAMWWIGGICAHAPALCAIICPTTNCYRRIVPGTWAPCNIGWGIDRRDLMLRVKTGTKNNTYIECRSASSAANPYLVMAAMIAAGLDGIENKIQPPDEGTIFQRLPLSLQEALDALDADEVLKSAMGDEFILWYRQAKRECDCKTQNFEDEKNMYLKLI